MKLNFWQVIGVILVLIALVLIIRRELSSKPTTKPSVAAVTASNLSL